MSEALQHNALQEKEDKILELSRDLSTKTKRATRTGLIVSLALSLAAFAWLVHATSRLANLSVEIAAKSTEIGQLQQKLEELRTTQADLLEFLATVTREEEIQILDPTVDWPELKHQLIDMPPGRRKQALLIALLYAWKDIPFTLGGETLSEGFDSPRFLQRVLNDVGVDFETSPNVRLSDSIMSQLDKTDEPGAGDLAFYQGQVGSFGFILLSPGDSETAPVGVGTLQRVAPLQVISLDNINTPVYPLIGYFRVHYPDE